MCGQIVSILPKIGVAKQDNITQNGTCPGRIKGGQGHTHTHTHTHDTDCPTLLLRNIQMTDTECTPFEHRINAEATQSLRRTYAELSQH